MSSPQSILSSSFNITVQFFFFFGIQQQFSYIQFILHLLVYKFLVQIVFSFNEILYFYYCFFLIFIIIHLYILFNRLYMIFYYHINRYFARVNIIDVNLLMILFSFTQDITYWNFFSLRYMIFFHSTLMSLPGNHSKILFPRFNHYQFIFLFGYEDFYIWNV